MTKISIFILGIVIALVLFEPFAWGKEVRLYVLVVGTNRAPMEDMLPLQFADDDAVRNWQIFERAAQKAILLTVMDKETQRRFPKVAKKTEPPTVAQFRRALDLIFAQIQKGSLPDVETEFVLVYSGHGRLLPGKEGAVTLQDGMLTRTDLYEQVLKKSPASFNHLLIDACNAYFLVQRRGEEEGWKPDKSGVQREEAAAFFAEQDLANYPQTGVVLSTSSEAEAHEWTLYQGGIFSHEVRSGLLGGADVNGDRKISYSELQAFIEAANHKVTDAKAKLRVFVAPPAQDRNHPLFDMDAVAKATTLMVPKETEGKFYLEDSKGTRYADFNKTAEQPVVLTLLPAKHYFLRNDIQSLEYLIPSKESSAVSLANVPSRSMRLASRGSVEETFRKDLFAQPFGKNFYEGLVAALREVPVEEAPIKTEVEPVPKELRPKLGTAAVFKIRPDLVDPGMAKILSDVTLAEIQALKLFDRIYSYNEMEQLLSLEEQKQLVRCEDSTSCMAEVSAAVGARYVVNGSVGKLGDTYLLNLSLVDNSEVKTIARQQERFTGGDANQFLPVTRTAVQRLFGQRGLGYIDGPDLVAGTKIVVGGQMEGEAPLPQPICLNTGTWTIKLEHPTLEEKSIEINVTAGTISNLPSNVPEAQQLSGLDETTIQETRPVNWRTPVAWVSLVVGLGSIAGGGVLTHFAIDRAHKYETEVVYNSTYRDDARTYSYAAIGLYGAGAALLGVSIYCFVTADYSGNTSEDGGLAQTIQPLVGVMPGGAITGVSTTF
ncbi:MAG: caspase family protein [Myxococcales bacterium]|nr:MAG: caspase family protein [Myxococcales bacterium]